MNQLETPRYHEINFNQHKIRCILHNHTWWFVISDVIAALTNSINPSNYIKNMKRRRPEFKKRMESVDTPLIIKTNGGSQKINCANLDKIFSLIKLIPSEKIEQFKHCITTNPVFINKAKIAAVKNDYGFEASFDLKKEIAYLPTSCALYPKFLRISKQRKEILASQAALRVFLHEFKSTSCSTNIILNQGLKDIKKLTYKDRRGMRSDWNINKIQKGLEILYKVYPFVLENTPKDPGGCQTSSKPLHIIFKLVAIYFRGTKKKPTCGWDDINGEYIGEFYNFVLDLSPILKSMNLHLGKLSSIGTYCREAIQHYNKYLNEYHQ